MGLKRAALLEREGVRMYPGVPGVYDTTCEVLNRFGETERAAARDAGRMLGLSGSGRSFLASLKAEALTNQCRSMFFTCWSRVRASSASADFACWLAVKLVHCSLFSAEACNARSDSRRKESADCSRATASERRASIAENAEPMSLW